MNAQAPQSFKRRHWLVHPGYQLRVATLLLAGSVLMVVTTLCLVYYALWSTLRALQLEHEAVYVEVFKAAAWMVTAEMVVLIPLVMVGAILLTHQVVGPLNRIRTAIQQMAHGQFDCNLILRKGDVLIDLAEDLNRLAVSLRSRPR